MPRGFVVLRSAVALNCCCGNCVTSRRTPSRSLALRMPPKTSWKFSTVSTLPCETSPRSGRVVRKMAGGNSGKKWSGRSKSISNRSSRGRSLISV